MIKPADCWRKRVQMAITEIWHNSKWLHLSKDDKKDIGNSTFCNHSGDSHPMRFKALCGRMLDKADPDYEEYKKWLDYEIQVARTYKNPRAMYLLTLLYTGLGANTW